MSLSDTVLNILTSLGSNATLITRTQSAPRGNVKTSYTAIKYADNRWNLQDLLSNRVNPADRQIIVSAKGIGRPTVHDKVNIDNKTYSISFVELYTFQGDVVYVLTLRA